MFCSNCGKQQAEGALFCTDCGHKLETVQPAVEEVAEPVVEEAVPAEPVVQEPVAAPVQAAPAYTQVPPYNPQQSYYQIPQEPQIPADHKPLSAWAYFGYQILFSLPVIGFILLIVFSFDNGNINLRNYARSHWCAVLIGVILFVLLLVLVIATGAMAGFSEEIYNMA